MRKGIQETIRAYSISIIVAVAVALLIRNFLIEAYRIPSHSMKPNLLAGDTLFVLKWPYSIGKFIIPKRGDIIVFSNLTKGTINSVDYIRRVIGLPGDQLKIRNGSVILNGQKLDSQSPSSPVRLKTKDLEEKMEMGMEMENDEHEFLEQLPDGKKYKLARGKKHIPDFGPEKIPPGFIFVLPDYRIIQEDKKTTSWGMIQISALKGKALWIWLSIKPENSSFTPEFRLERMFRKIQ